MARAIKIFPRWQHCLRIKFRQRSLLASLSLTALIFSACKSEVKYPVNEGNIRNGIQLKTNGVLVEQAFLTYEDGSPVDESNTTTLNKKIKINFIVQGWQEQNGQVPLEASEKVTTSNGKVVMHEKELFSKGGMKVLSAVDAQFPRLTVEVSGMNKPHEYYLVSFRIWNKGTDQWIEGEYKFRLV
jgi:hypothetical protein